MWCGPTKANATEGAAGDTAGAPPFVARNDEEISETAIRPQGPIATAAHFIARATNTIALRLAAYIYLHPKQTYWFAILLMFGIVFWPHRAKAGPVSSLLTNVQSFGTAGISNSITLIGLGLFMTLALATIGYQATVYAAHHNNSLRGFSNEVIVLALNLILPFGLVFGIGWLPGVLAGVPALGQTWGDTIYGGSAATFTTSLPTIMGVGSTASWTLLGKIWQAVMPQNTTSGNWWDLAKAFFSGGFLDDATRLVVLLIGFVICGIIILCFAMVAVEILMAYIQFYLTMPAAAWTLGFHGSPRTEGLANQYWNVVVRSLVRFIVVVGVVSWMLMNTASWSSDIKAASFVATQSILNPDGSINTSASSDIGILTVALEYLFAAVIMAAVVRRTPDMADAALSGSPALGGAGFVMNAKMGAAAFAGGMLGGEAGAMAGGGGEGGGSRVGGVLGGIGRTARQGAEYMHNLFESGGR